MSVFVNSEYTFSTLYTEFDTGDIMLTDPNPIGFIAFEDNIPHTVAEGDTLWGLADTYFPHYDRACGLWKAIADFNSIYDPSLDLEVGTVLYVPSERTLSDTFFSNDRYSEVSASVA